MNSRDLRDLWTRLLRAMETLDDVSALIGPSDREQAARLRKLLPVIEAEISVLAQKIAAARVAERSNNHG